MPGRGESVKLGPFVGGMNTASDPTIVADSELIDIVNMELDLDGSLVQRPPFATYNSGITASNISVIGSAFIGGVGYLIFAIGNDTYIFNGNTNVYSVLKTNLKSKVALQYRDKIYVVATQASTQDGGYYDVGTSTFTAQATMPRGEAAVFYKARLFVVAGIDSTTNTSRFQFCDPITADAFTWTGTNIVDVSPGDGQKLVDVVVYNDNLMFFKEDSTWVFAYDLQISDAVLRNVNPNIGATSSYCVAQYENSVFVFHDSKVYEISNYDFSHINIKVPFVLDVTVVGSAIRTENISISLVGDKLVVRYYNRVYVYGLKTKTWSRWDVTNTDYMYFGHFVRLPTAISTNEDAKYYSSSTNHYTTPSIRDVSTPIFIPNGHQVLSGTPALEGTLTSYVITKNYDFSDSQHFKKLMWWGADLLTSQEIFGYATPVLVNAKPTWNTLSTYTWNQLSGNYWSDPLIAPSGVTTDVNIPTSVFRKFVKFRKALRFREINFKVILSGDGTVTTGPARLFSLTAIVNAKQLVSKQVS